MVSAILLVAACGTGPSSPVPSEAPSASPATASATAPASASATASPAASASGLASPRPPTPPAPSPSSAPADPNLVTVTFQPVVTVPGGPLALAAPPDGTGRLFIAAKDGRIWILADGKVGPTPLLDLRGLVSNGGEQGLLGIAIHPGFPGDPRVFVDYTNRDGNTVVASYALAGGAAGSADRLDPASATRIITVNQPFANHNGGALAFGPDGMLYVSLGDGGSADDPLGNGQRTDTLLGKILRLDMNVPPGAVRPYVIPTDNPFAGTSGARPEIWLTGLRNPWRISFDRGTGDLWIGDVGQNAWEEVDVARAGVGGLNFGWDRMEGRHCHEPASGCDPSGITMPVAEYGHDAGCTVIGGDVYRGAAQPLLSGLYIFADYCSGRLWAIPAAGDGPTEPVRIGTAGAGIAGFGEDADGELYAANLDGTISRLVAARR